jgi:catechol 2,3-dioxygenase-like lactoylglutathione lyase family enzyme
MTAAVRKPTASVTAAKGLADGMIVGVAFRVVALDHVQLAMPPAAEAVAEAFYCGVLGFEVDVKPEPLAARGGRWFACGDVHVHLGAEAEFRPARKAHPALVVDDFDALICRLDAAGVVWRPDEELPGVRRCHIDDPFGNRIELIAQRPEAVAAKAVEVTGDHGRPGT